MTPALDLYDGLTAVGDACPNLRPMLERFLARATGDPDLELGAEQVYSQAPGGYRKLALLIADPGLPEDWLETHLRSQAQ